MRIGGGQEFVIGGDTPSSRNFDALVAGFYEGDKLIYASRVRTGFVPSVLDLCSADSRSWWLILVRSRTFLNQKRDDGARGSRLRI
jgi:hypothetical protein